jgi:hypothetical protein
MSKAKHSRETGNIDRIPFREAEEAAVAAAETSRKGTKQSNQKSPTKLTFQCCWVGERVEGVFEVKPCR